MINSQIDDSRRLFLKQDRLVSGVQEKLVKSIPVTRETYFLYELHTSIYLRGDQFKKVNHIAGYRIRALRIREFGRKGRFIFDCSLKETALRKLNELVERDET